MLKPLFVFSWLFLVSTEPQFWAATSDEQSLFPAPLVKLKHSFTVLVEEGHRIGGVWLSRHEECEIVDVKAKIITKTKHFVTVEATEATEEFGGPQTLFICANPIPTIIFHRTVRFDPKDHVNVFFVFIYVVGVGLSCLFTGLNLALLSLDVETLEMVKNYDEDLDMRQFAEDILPIRKDPNLMICTIILGNTLCNVVSTIVFAQLTKGVELGDWQKYLLITAVPTFVLLIFSEIIPQIVCTKYAIPIGARLQNVMRFFTIIMFPIAKSIALALDIIVGKDSSKSKALRDIQRFAQRKEKMAMVVTNTLKLRKRTAKDVMTPMDRVKKISDREPVSSQLRESLKTSHTRMPVYKAGDPNHLCGVFNVKDLLLIEDSPYITVGTVMQMWPRTSTCRFVSADMPVYELMLELKTGCSLACVIEFLPIGAETKMVTTGIVTLEDMLEEVIGEIYDEKDLRRVANAGIEVGKEEAKQHQSKTKKQPLPKPKDDIKECKTEKAGRSKAARSKRIRVEEKVVHVMTKITNEAPAASTAEAALHSVQAGRVEKAESAPDAPKAEFKRIKYKRFALLLSYQGKDYYGMQMQKELPTIESHVIAAMHKLGWITDEEKTTPFKFYFQRAARTDKAVSAVRQICGMQLPLTFEYELDGPEELNKLLPPDIRAMGMRRTTNHFHPQKNCDARTYSYTLPTFAFAKPHQLTDADFRISKETIDEVNSLLDIYIGTHNFFNYTSKKEFKDASCHRFIMSFKCGEPFLYKDTLRDKDVEFISITVKGQSFILHQIRKMIGMVITVTRELQLRSYIQKSFEDNRIDVPKAPGLGLLLERVHYDYYDNKFPPQLMPLSDWGKDTEAAVEKVKFELITKEILETEVTAQSMFQWLAELPRHDFSADPESDQPAQKSFLTMAMAQVTKAEEKEAAKETSMDGAKEAEEQKIEETVEVKKEETVEVKKEEVIA